jgi:hypothetical protein
VERVAAFAVSLHAGVREEANLSLPLCDAECHVALHQLTVLAENSELDDAWISAKTVIHAHDSSSKGLPER